MLSSYVAQYLVTSQLAVKFSDFAGDNFANSND